MDKWDNKQEMQFKMAGHQMMWSIWEMAWPIGLREMVHTPVKMLQPLGHQISFSIQIEQWNGKTNQENYIMSKKS